VRRRLVTGVVWRCLALVGLLGLLGACAVTTYPIDEPSLPERVHATEGSPRAVILALHGFNDYSHAFDGFAQHAATLGYRVEAFDQQGFGGSANRGLWPGNAALAADLRDRIAALAEAWPDTPLFVLGESMGGAVAVVGLAQGAPEVDGLILSAPAVWGGDALNPFYRAVLVAAASMMPDRTLTGRGLERQASDNIEMLIRFSRDPQVIKETRLDAVAGLVGLMDEAVAQAPALDVPVLVLMGERDEIIPPEVIAGFIDTLELETCQSIVYPDGWHMLLRDLQRERVWSDIIDWIEDEEPADARACGGAVAAS
jgi:alpha-beta hydrolase superfamily lysophospholipase